MNIGELEFWRKIKFDIRLFGPSATADSFGQQLAHRDLQCRRNPGQREHRYVVVSPFDPSHVAADQLRHQRELLLGDPGGLMNPDSVALKTPIRSFERSGYVVLT